MLESVVWRPYKGLRKVVMNVLVVYFQLPNTLQHLIHRKKTDPKVAKRERKKARKVSYLTMKSVFQNFEVFRKIIEMAMDINGQYFLAIELFPKFLNVINGFILGDTFGEEMFQVRKVPRKSPQSLCQVPSCLNCTCQIMG